MVVVFVCLCATDLSMVLQSPVSKFGAASICTRTSSWSNVLFTTARAARCFGGQRGSALQALGAAERAGDAPLAFDFQDHYYNTMVDLVLECQLLS